MIYIIHYNDVRSVWKPTTFSETMGNYYYHQKTDDILKHPITTQPAH